MKVLFNTSVFYLVLGAVAALALRGFAAQPCVAGASALGAVHPHLIALGFFGFLVATLFALRWRINILTMGDDEAATMGVNARRTRIVVIVAATLVTAASVCVTGMIGWVGLVIPHLCRMLVGVDYRRLIPASMLMGASFLLIVDDVARLATTAEIPIGILTAFVGAPFFLYLITRKKKL